MIGDSCSIINNVANCYQSIVASGVDSGLKMYLLELKTNQQIAKSLGFNKTLFLKIEKYSGTIESSFIFGLSLYINYTNTVVGSLEKGMSLITCLYFILLAACYILLLHKIADELAQNLANKAEILSVFMKKGQETSISSIK
jgi:hypothetical protein